MTMRKTSRRHTDKSSAELAGEPTRLEGFVPIVPQRKKFVEDLAKINEANEGSSRADSHSCWLPLDEGYKTHRNELSEALRRETELACLGSYRPMEGDDLCLSLEVVVPQRTRRKNALHDVATTFIDAMRFNLWTTDEKRLGLVSESTELAGLRLSKRIATDDEEGGVRFALTHGWRDDGKEDPVQTAKPEPAPSPLSALPVEAQVVLLSSCLADEDTPLDPTVIDYYKALSSRFDGQTARLLALAEQTRMNVAGVDGQDGEAIRREIEERTNALNALGGRRQTMRTLEDD